MPAAYTTLTLGDGTTDADLVDGTNYILVNGGWSPQNTYRLRGGLWRRGPYADVEESITINIYGADGATLLANVDKLAKLMDQAGRWAEGQGVTAVTLEVLPQGSEGTALSAVVYGQRDRPSVIHPAEWNDLLMTFTIDGVQLEFLRAGPWLAASDTATATAVANPGLMTATFGSTHPTPSPLKIELTGFTSSSPDTGTGFLIVANDSNKIVQFNAEAATSATNSTSVADATHFALGNVLNINGDISGVYDSASYFPNFLSTIREVSFYATVRNNDTDDPQVLGVQATDTAGGTYSTSGTILPGVDGGTANFPVAVYLGTIKLAAPLAEFYLERGAYNPLGVDTLDVDTLVMLGRNGVHDETCRAVPFGPVGPASSGNWKHVFDPRALTSPTPFVGSQMTTGGAQVSGQWGGDAYLLTSGTVVRAVYLAPVGVNWRHVTSGSATSIGFTATRHKAFLTPQ